MNIPIRTADDKGICDIYPDRTKVYTMIYSNPEFLEKITEDTVSGIAKTVHGGDRFVC